MFDELFVPNYVHENGRGCLSRDWSVLRLWGLVVSSILGYLRDPLPSIWISFLCVALFALPGVAFVILELWVFVRGSGLYCFGISLVSPCSFGSHSHGMFLLFGALCVLVALAQDAQGGYAHFFGGLCASCSYPDLEIFTLVYLRGSLDDPASSMPL
ncbi:hypothetical protein SUGI_1064190 [Cryptomeria japonica]|nr:hypothetical protein SUGI_1064190 [Cryptomeria japonica]